MYYSHGTLHFHWETKPKVHGLELSLNSTWYKYKVIRNFSTDYKVILIILGISIFYAQRERASFE